MQPCGYCGMLHGSRCPSIQAIEYYPDGTVKRVEFVKVQPAPAGSGWTDDGVPVFLWATDRGGTGVSEANVGGLTMKLPTKEQIAERADYLYGVLCAQMMDEGVRIKEERSGAACIDRRVAD
jgi:hypothetical protein